MDSRLPSLTERAQRRGARRRRPRRRLRLTVALAVAVSAALTLAGCAPLGQDRILAEVKKSVEKSDPDLLSVSTESSKDGFANVIFVGVAISDDTIDADRLKTLMKAAIDTPGATRFDQLHFAVAQTDFTTGLVNLDEPGRELGFDSLSDTDITVDTAVAKKILG
ncbi:hypothetical protein [Schumannella soli]|uniref:hypothetical protein n=1 Tax=Schumannella soli TaxID=2590779 RepID=UPI0015E86A17|nr:hypothetical protein [Schumannella soli]